MAHPSCANIDKKDPYVKKNHEISDKTTTRFRPGNHNHLVFNVTGIGLSGSLHYGVMIAQATNYLFGAEVHQSRDRHIKGPLLCKTC